MFIIHSFVFLAVDIEEWNAQRAELIKKADQDHFSNDITLEAKELKVEEKLVALREQLLEEDGTIATGFYYEKLDKLLGSKLYECLNVMPKPAVHHIHLTAAAPISYLVSKMCTYDFVYYSEKDELFKVSKKGCDQEGYVPVNTLRQYWESSTAFDEHITEKILLSDGTRTLEHHEIWKYFQPKFSMTFGKFQDQLIVIYHHLFVLI